MRPDAEHSPPLGEQRLSAERTDSRTAIATLLPAEAPGRLTRKARQYRTQIVHLRALGYTLEAIQQALAAVGVPVSISTVRREAVHPLPVVPWPIAAPGVASASFAATPSTRPPTAPAPGVASPVIPGLPDTSNGKDVAAAYAHRKSGNALTRAKEKS